MPNDIVHKDILLTPEHAFQDIGSMLDFRACLTNYLRNKIRDRNSTHIDLNVSFVHVGGGCDSEM